MTTIKELHEEAMDLADRALFARRAGDLESAKALFQQAFLREKAAVEELTSDDEPTRSILLRSAATLALDSGNTRESERLVGLGLAGNPPPEIAVELRELFDQVNFERHLEIKGITLESNELQLSVVGSVVGHGVALTDVIIKRISEIDKLIKRTVERIRGEKFRTQGATKGSIADAFSLYMSAPRPGSLSITLKVGQQAMLPGFDETVEVVDELITCLELASENLHDELRHRISDEDYFSNFVRLTKEIAPDGERVTQVGITTVRNGKENRISLRKPKREIQNALPSRPEEEKEATRESVEVIGMLQYADKMKAENEIKLLDRGGQKYTVVVPVAYMNDIVRPLWDTMVKVTGTKGKKGKIYLHDIEAYEGK